MTKRKVRADFDKSKEYSVLVEGCSEEEKKEVQQAFFDVGILWGVDSKQYQHLDAVQYSNTDVMGRVGAYCLYGHSTEGCNMTIMEFLDLVYEPIEEIDGHIHAELMAQYAEDAKTHSEPWKLWEFRTNNDDWVDCSHHPRWWFDAEYRRKPKTYIVHGVEIPDLRVKPGYGEQYYLADPTELDFNTLYTNMGDSCDEAWVSRGLCYAPTEEGKQASILHSKAMLGIA